MVSVWVVRLCVALRWWCGDSNAKVVHRVAEVAGLRGRSNVQ